MLFKQNSEIFYIKEKNVDNNVFVRGEEKYTHKKVSFAKIKDSLPKPVWDNHKAETDCYYYAYKIAFQNIRKATKKNGFVADFIDAAFNGRTFMWDSCFMTQFGKFADRIFSFQHTLDNFYAKQHKDGFICKEVDEKSGLDAYTRFDMSGTGPNIFAYFEWAYYLQFGDKERLKKIYAPLLAYRNWFKENRTWKDGSYFSNGIGSGLDNAPRLESSYDNVLSNGKMTWVDITLQAYINDNTLLKIAREIGTNEGVEDLEKESSFLKEFIRNKLWDDKTAFFYDLFSSGELSETITVAPYWALLTDILDRERLDRFVAHLNDENEFKTSHRVPSLPKNNPKYSDYGDYCNGAVLIPTNYIVIYGLEASGYDDLSYEIAENHYINVINCYKQTGSVWENYSSKNCKPGIYISGNEDFSRKDFVGWTGLVPITLLIEKILGIEYNSISDTLTWTIRQTDRHGIEGYVFGKDGKVDMLCEAREKSERPKITIRSNRDVNLRIMFEKETVAKRLSADCEYKFTV